MRGVQLENTRVVVASQIGCMDYTIPTNDNDAGNSYANFNSFDRMNEETKEALTIKEKTKGTEPSFEDQRNDYIRSH